MMGECSDGAGRDKGTVNAWSCDSCWAGYVVPCCWVINQSTYTAKKTPFAYLLVHACVQPGHVPSALHPERQGPREGHQV